MYVVGLQCLTKGLRPNCPSLLKVLHNRVLAIVCARMDCYKMTLSKPKKIPSVLNFAVHHSGVTVQYNFRHEFQLDLLPVSSIRCWHKKFERRDESVRVKVLGDHPLPMKQSGPCGKPIRTARENYFIKQVDNCKLCKQLRMNHKNCKSIKNGGKWKMNLVPVLKGKEGWWTVCGLLIFSFEATSHPSDKVNHFNKWMWKRQSHAVMEFEKSWSSFYITTAWKERLVHFWAE